MARKMLPKPKHKGRWLELSVVGINHRVALNTIQHMAKSLPIPVTLEREPGNQADENAIRVVIGKTESWDRGDWHIGYLRRSMAEVIAPLMDREEIEFLSVTLTGLDDEEGREGTLDVVVETEKPLGFK